MRVSALWAGSSLCLVILALACGYRDDRAKPAARRSVLDVPSGRTLRSFSVSPDGRLIAYAAENAADQRMHLYVRAVDGTADREISSSLGAHSPFFSPDGVWVAYFARGGIWKSRVSPNADATAPDRVADGPTDSAGGAWTSDGRIIFAPLANHGLMVVPAAGGNATDLTALTARDGELEHGWPYPLPGGAILFTVTQRGRDPHLEVLAPNGERARLPVPVVGQAQFVDGAHLVYGYLGNLFAIAFDVRTYQTRGVPFVVDKNLQTLTGFGNLGRTGFSVSPTGTLVSVPATPADVRSLIVRVDRAGRYEPLTAPAEVYQTPRISPDGRRLAVVVRAGVMTREIRVLDVAKAADPPVTIQGGDNQSPAWMPDSRRLSFGSNRDGTQTIYVATVDRRGRVPAQVKPLFSIGISTPRNPASWTRSPPLLALYEIDSMRRRDVMVYRVGEMVLPVAATPANERSPVLSPDGRWIGYVSDASGRDEIYAKRLDDEHPALQLTTTGAIEPVWTREGLFYRDGDRVMLIVWTDGRPGQPKEVLDGVFEHDPGANLAAYDIDPTGKYFLMLKSAVVARQLNVITNWTSDLAGAQR